MSLAKPRLSTMMALILLAIALLALTLSSPVKAAVLQFLGSYNGVNLAIDPETESLVANGNPGSVFYQDDGEIFIQNAPQTGGIAVIIPDTQTIPLTDLLARYPDFNLPAELPPGYSLNAEGIIFENEGRNGVMVSWTHPAGERLTYYRGEQPPNEIGTVTTTYEFVVSLQGDNQAQLTWKADGYFYQIIATDESLTEEELKNIAP